MEGLFSTMNRIKQFLFTGTLIALVLTALLGIILSNMITAPIKEITNKAAAMAVGNLDQQVHVLTGDEIGQLGLAFNDMTQRLREALFSIEEEKEKLASILSNMSDGVIAADEQRRVIVMNRRARAMLAIPADQSVEGQEVLTLLQLTAGEVSEHAWQQGAVHVVKLKPTEINEESLTAKITYSPIQRRGLGVIGTVLLLHDVTEQEQMETSRKEFVANVSHELRTPLTTIKSYLEALDEGVIEDPSLAQRFIGVTRNETERMIRLVTDLLHLSRLDSHQLKLRRETLNIVTILEEVADRFSVQASQRSMELIVESDIDELLVYADRDAIDQVLDNLISNAMKFSPKGGEVKLEAQRIDVNSTMPTEKIEISIRDQGTGIPKKDLDRIFERFYRVDKARSRDMGGTGLGLSIALEIVKAHGGTIRIDSQVGAGTRVVFTLPTKPGERERR
jgi:two-component system sensor histidine kinase VicK